jgi:hypothetical protein
MGMGVGVSVTVGAEVGVGVGVAVGVGTKVGAGEMAAICADVGDGAGDTAAEANTPLPARPMAAASSTTAKPVIKAGRERRCRIDMALERRPSGGGAERPVRCGSIAKA